MNHMEEITDGLMDTFRGLRGGTVEAKDAQEIANVAGKVISAYKTRIAYAALRGDIPIIDGLETSTAKVAIDTRGKVEKALPSYREPDEKVA